MLPKLVFLIIIVVLKPRIGRIGGGVAIYVRDHLCFLVKLTYECGEFEFTFVSLETDGNYRNTVTVGVVHTDHLILTLDFLIRTIAHYCLHYPIRRINVISRVILKYQLVKL